MSAPGEVFGYVVGRDISGDSDKDSDVLTPGGTVFYNATTKLDVQIEDVYEDYSNNGRFDISPDEDTEIE